MKKQTPTNFNFNLARLKTTKRSGLSVDWTETAGKKITAYKQVSGEPPHPDLHKALAELKDLYNYVFGNPNVDVEIVGIKVAGEMPYDKLIIVGTMTNETGIPVEVNTYRIDLETDADDKLYDTLRKITAEAYAYVFQGKAAQMKMFGKQTENQQT